MKSVINMCALLLIVLTVSIATAADIKTLASALAHEEVFEVIGSGDVSEVNVLEETDAKDASKMLKFSVTYLPKLPVNSDDSEGSPGICVARFSLTYSPGSSVAGEPIAPTVTVDDNLCWL